YSLFNRRSEVLRSLSLDRPKEIVELESIRATVPLQEQGNVLEQAAVCVLTFSDTQLHLQVRLTLVRFGLKLGLFHVIDGYSVSPCRDRLKVTALAFFLYGLPRNVDCQFAHLLFSLIAFIISTIVGLCIVTGKLKRFLVAA